MPKQLNATHLFENHKKSEQWWTSLFSIVLVHLAHEKSDLTLWRYQECSVSPSDIAVNQLNRNKASMNPIMEPTTRPVMKYITEPHALTRVESTPLASEPMLLPQHAVGAVDHDRDGRQDERVFRHRLATRVARSPSRRPIRRATGAPVPNTNT
jgi:hypothetical protein